MQKALKYDIDDKKIYNNFGTTLANMDYYEEILKAFTKSGGLAKAYHNLGVIYLTKVMYKKALPVFEKAIELNSKFYDKAS